LKWSTGECVNDHMSIFCIPLSNTVLFCSLSSHLSKSDSLYFEQAKERNLMGKSTKRKRGSSTKGEDNGSPLKALMASKTNSPFDIDWDRYKPWPEGIKEEERAMSDYMERLATVHIEQQTKDVFMQCTSDNSEKAYTVEDVKQLEAEVEEWKAALKEREGLFGTVREEIERLADQLQEYDVLQKNLRRAMEMAEGIRRMESEIAELRASREAANVNKSERQFFTEEEAVERINQQVSVAKRNFLILHLSFRIHLLSSDGAQRKCASVYRTDQERY
jgi:hypothetical protein